MMNVKLQGKPQPEEFDTLESIADEKIGTARKRAYVSCLGCPESQIDSARVQVFLKKNGYVISKNSEEADLVLFRTCGFTEESEIASLEAIRNIKSKMKRGTLLIPWGCLHKIHPDALTPDYVTFGEKDMWKLNEIVAAREPIEKVQANFLSPKYKKSKVKKITDFPRTHHKQLWLHERNHPIFKPGKYGSPFFIKASTGCLGGCTYCAIRLSRGKVKSKRIEEVLSEFERGRRLGFKDFRLLGTDLGAYGRDRGRTLVDLLSKMTQEEGEYAISLRNINPYWLTRMYNEMKPILSSGKIRYMSSAVESGSNRILELMGRRYTTEELIPIIQDLNRSHPSILINTQFMVGFPTESKQDHRQSERVLKECLFDMVEVYKFSGRLGTPAAKMNGQIPENTKTTRYLRLLATSMLNIIRRNITRLYR